MVRYLPHRRRATILAAAVVLFGLATSLVYSRLVVYLDAMPYRYSVLLPDGHLGEAASPLLVYLHGAGWKRREALLNEGVARFARSRQDFPFLVALPHCPKWRQPWSADLLNNLLDEIMSKYRVDPERIYISGFSSGGYVAWQMAHRYSERVAAIVPVAGGAFGPGSPCGARPVSVWAFHGQADQVVPLAASEEMVAEFRRCGGEVRMTAFPGVGHGGAMAAFEDPRVYAWLLRQSRKSVDVDQVSAILR